MGRGDRIGQVLDVQVARNPDTTIDAAGSGGGATTDVDDRLDDLVGIARDIAPRDRPALDELVDEYGLLPFEQAVTSLDTSPHRYTWHCLEVEKGARRTTFTLSHGEPATYWMYLVDPSGEEVHPSAAGVRRWQAGPGPEEIAEIERPAAGPWLAIGVRLDRGAAVSTEAIAAIDHPEITVFGRAHRHGTGSVEFRAGARFVEPLTGLAVTARFHRPGGPWHDLHLHDDLLGGVYRGWADLVGEPYTGFIEIRAPERPPLANTQHVVLHTGSRDGIGAPRAETAGFVRHVPISVVPGAEEFPCDTVRDGDRAGDVRRRTCDLPCRHGPPAGLGPARRTEPEEGVLGIPSALTRW